MSISIPTLGSVMTQGTPLVAPTIYDGISALAVRELGFQAAYVGSQPTSATMYGLPDIGYVSLNDMADQVRRLGAITEIPLIVDGEGGWGNPLHVTHSVKVLERAGAAGIQIEDHLWGKHIDIQTVLPLGESIDKIKAAVDARSSEETLIIARSDAMPTEGLEATIDRLLAFEEAGADALFMAAPAVDATHERLVSQSNALIVSLSDEQLSSQQLGDRGADILIYFVVTPLAATSGIRAALSALALEGSTHSVDAVLGPLAEFDKFTGIEQARVEARRFGLLKS
ncbi:isocitrate lyase/PEP mutase family protein [Protaetiibacter intestinalis]|uniref:Isocitrate lyase/PEP mutase family protein n=1 Tax=Protaetiibacter intestinalis TaxID=2419774 RepID=A0A387BA70_9MICO|nr:isocitrate lyase/PEP mutase family protein [Protaetiibacter intestinalis]AYF99263.1 hypothetical protein D7I47_14035 [Protaetiibacter intestinalis]